MGGWGAAGYGQNAAYWEQMQTRKARHVRIADPVQFAKIGNAQSLSATKQAAKQMQLCRLWLAQPATGGTHHAIRSVRQLMGDGVVFDVAACGWPGQPQAEWCLYTYVRHIKIAAVVEPLAAGSKMILQPDRIHDETGT